MLNYLYSDQNFKNNQKTTTTANRKKLFLYRATCVRLCVCVRVRGRQTQVLVQERSTKKTTKVLSKLI